MHSPFSLPDLEGAQPASTWGRCERRIPVARRSTLMPIVPVGELRISAISAERFTGRYLEEATLSRHIVLEIEGSAPQLAAIDTVTGLTLGGRFEQPRYHLRSSRAGDDYWSARHGKRLRPVDITARMSLAGRGQIVEVFDISRAGAKIETRTALIPGQQILFFLNFGMPLTGRVRWTRGGKAGLGFQDPLSG